MDYIEICTEGRNRTGTDVKGPRDFKSLVSTNFTTSATEASTRFELVHNGFADRSLTAWVRRQKTGLFKKRPRAKDRIRTDDPHVGNVMLYQLSYFRKIYRIQGLNFISNIYVLQLFLSLMVRIPITIMIMGMAMLMILRFWR